MEDKFKCGVCEKTFKTESGLLGHMRFSHQEQKVKTTPDKVAERLEALEAQLAGSHNPGNPIKSEEDLVTTLKLLLPAMERFKLVIVNFGSRYDDDYLQFKRYRILKNPDFSQAGFGGLVVGTGVQEL